MLLLRFYGDFKSSNPCPEHLYGLNIRFVGYISDSVYIYVKTSVSIITRHVVTIITNISCQDYHPTPFILVQIYVVQMD